MFEFAWLWMFLLLPLPFIVRKILKPKKDTSQKTALKVPFLHEFNGQASAKPPTQRHWFNVLLASLAWLFFVTALARPVWVDEVVEMPVSGRDLMLAVDLSGSMQERDFELNGHLVDRLVATKAVAGQFIKKREGDRIGLILFGDRAYLQAPLTFDRTTVITLLNEAALGLAGEKTAIGDAIGLAIKQLRRNPDQEQVLILMTDGANTAGAVSPNEAASLAAQEGLKIYTVGIGSEQTRRNAFGFGLSVPRTDLDERTLTAIAEKTGGRYFRARDIQEFQQIYALLDRLEPVEKDAARWYPREDLFRLPLALSLLFMGFLLINRILTNRGHY
ncbi:MAG: vWA domain-containing protein [bacterium]